MILVFATNNKNKLKELQSLLPKSIELLSLEDISCFEDIEETELTLKGNAKLKADFITNKYGYDCFADDTGLEVEFLNGAPGVYSARYAGEKANSQDNMRKLLDKLSNVDNRNAQFKTVICLNLQGKQYLFEGVCKGTILTEKSGESGFGYDPIFKPEGFDIPFAEMSMEQKGRISHRGKAVAKLVEFLNIANK